MLVLNQQKKEITLILQNTYTIQINDAVVKQMTTGG